MKNILIKIIMTFVMVVILFMVNIKEVLLHIPRINTFKDNLEFFQYIIEDNITLVIIGILIFIYLFCKNRIAISVPKIEIAGIEINIRHTEKIVKANLNNYFNTKRSLFAINIQQDNFYDVFTSYYESYSFIRTQMSYYEDFERTNEELYKNMENMLRDLNIFLTAYQSDYRRWYEEKMKDEFMFLSDLQPSYPRYNQLINAFTEVNIKMKKYAETMGINIDKWG